MIEENVIPPTEEEIANLLKQLEDGEINIEAATPQTTPEVVIHLPPSDGQRYMWDDTTTTWVLFTDDTLQSEI